MYGDCSCPKRTRPLRQRTYFDKWAVAKATLPIRQEQSPNIAQGLVINCLSRGEQGFLWPSIWSQSGHYQPVPSHYWKLPLSQSLKESMHTYLCHFPGHNDLTLSAVLNSANRLPIQVTMDHIHSLLISVSVANSGPGPTAEEEATLLCYQPFAK